MANPVTTPARSPRLSGGERREQILDVTLALVAGEGFHAVTIDAVARGAGITRPIVYGHFTDLPGLLHALVDRESARALEQLVSVVPTAADARATLDIAVAALTAFLDAVVAAPDRWKLVLMPIEGGPRVLRDRIAADRARVHEQLTGVVAAALERDGVPAGLVDVPLIAHAVQDAAENAARLVLTDPERYPVERIVSFTRAGLARLLRP